MSKAKRFINYHVSRNSPYYANYFLNIAQKWVSENLNSDAWNGPLYIMYATRDRYSVRFIGCGIELWVPKTEVRLCR